ISSIGWLPIRFIGGLLIAGGAAVLLDSFCPIRALQGLGTPAPVFPTRHIVITGLYRYVRNPMYAAVGYHRGPRFDARRPGGLEGPNVQELNTAAITGGIR